MRFSAAWLSGARVEQERVATDSASLSALLACIHMDPVRHGIVERPRVGRVSSPSAGPEGALYQSPDQRPGWEGDRRV